MNAQKSAAKLMPLRAHLAPPAHNAVHSIEECDEILARGCPSQEITDAWLEKRTSAMHSRDIQSLEKKLGLSG